MEQQCLRVVLEEGLGVDQAPSGLRAKVEGVRGMVGEYMVTDITLDTRKTDGGEVTKKD